VTKSLMMPVELCVGGLVRALQSEPFLAIAVEPAAVAVEGDVITQARIHSAEDQLGGA
jgi:hypothetical protein